ncbi:MAG: GNAT family N-acetyltransferase [Leptospiraceae bacterium]|nr:GNAT family N-acetyltransferase [Leptospiraceae bacterium]MCP5500611.1 GNAT family N-acetyltransferase [Leptospiraceae bacterium]
MTAKKKTASNSQKIASKKKSGKSKKKSSKKVNIPQEVSHKINLRNILVTDFSRIQEIMNLVYSNAGGSWTEEQFSSQLSRFPEGQICIEDNGLIVAAALSIVVTYDKYGDKHTYDQITAKGYLTNHEEEGDTLYGVDIFIHPDYQGLRLGRRLYDARKELCERLNLKRIIVGGRIPGYKNHHGKMTPQKYIQQIAAKELFDPVLSFQLANDFHVIKVLTGYFPEDTESKSFAVLLEWINIYYEEPSQKLIGGAKSIVRVGVVQWQMRSVTSYTELLQQMEFFVDAVSGYKADFVLFPEFFNFPLMAHYNQHSPSDSIRALAQHTDTMRKSISNLAVSYNINIIAGSMPVYTEAGLYNVSYLCKRDGTIDEQYKIHVTPDESSYWGTKGGDKIKVFETDVGNIGILICYDVEFPELARILAERGMDILFVPFSTDTKNAYLRVRHCSQARAIENECYVVISGSVGNLPAVENMDIQYAQSAVFTPSDFSFPHDAIAAQATPNTEMTLIVDLDLDLLKELHMQGSVRNLQSRRPELYRIDWYGNSI